MQLLFALAHTSLQYLLKPSTPRALSQHHYSAAFLVLSSLPTTTSFFFCFAFFLILFSKPWPAQYYRRLEIERARHHVVVPPKPCIWPER